MPLSTEVNVSAPTPKTIGLLEHMGTGNLGDDATVDAAMQQIRERWPHAVMVGLSLDPADTEQRHGIPAHAIRRGFRVSPELKKPNSNRANCNRNALKDALRNRPFLFRALRTIKQIALRPVQFVQELVFLIASYRVTSSLDLLIICGGGQLLDAWGGPREFPYTIFKWVLLARLSGVKCYFVNVGAGPLKSLLGRWLIKHALTLADYVSFRDDKSRELIREIGFEGTSEVVADNAYALTFPDSATDTDSGGRRSQFVVGVGPMAYCDPRVYWNKNQAVYDDYIDKLSRFCVWLIQSHYRLRLLTTDIWFDSRAIADLEMAIKSRLTVDATSWLISEPISGIAELLCQMRQVDCVVTSKFHGVIFAHLLNKPMLAISHHSKVGTLMDELELSEYSVDIRTFDVEVLKAKFSRLAADSEAIKRRLPAKARQYRRELAAQFDRLFSPEGSACPVAENRGVMEE